MRLLLLWALTGGAIATWVMIRIWLPDPPPDAAGKFISTLVAGVIGGVVGGSLIGGVAGSDPIPIIPALVGALAGGLILSGALSILSGVGKRAAAR